MMKTQERRARILSLLSDGRVLSGAAIAKELGVSRQVVVRDISALKEEGYQILSTHFGYVCRKNNYAERVCKVRHTHEQTEDELRLIVSMDGGVVDVYVWHKVYGKIRAPLDIYTQEDVDVFMENISSGKSTELMSVTGGYHYHTLRAETEETLDRIIAALAERGYVVSFP